MIRAGLAELDKREMCVIDDWLHTSEGKRAAQSAYEASHEREEKRIGRTCLRQLVGRGMRCGLPATLKAIACLIMIFYLGLTVAVATVQQVRLKLYQFIINIEKEYTELELKEDAIITIDVPYGWEGDYFPSYIPVGLELKYVDPITSSEDCSVFYQSGEEKRWLLFSEYTSGTSENINTENAEISWREIDGSNCFIADRGTEVFITWAISDRYFVIWTDGNMDEALRICEGVMKISK